MAHLATVVPIVRETELSAWMKHASVVLVLPTLTALTGEDEPRSEETEPPPVRIRWVRQSARSQTGGGSREARLQQPSPFEAHRDPQPQPIPWAKLGPPYRRGLPRRRGFLNLRTRTAICRGHQEDFAKSANFRSRIRLPITLDRAGVLLEWLHPRSAHASPHTPVRNPRKSAKYGGWDRARNQLLPNSCSVPLDGIRVPAIRRLEMDPGRFWRVAKGSGFIDLPIPLQQLELFSLQG
jgi:hypothetical protein